MKVMLHVCQTMWVGGTNTYVLDFMKAYPEFHHEVLYLYDSNVNEVMLNEFKQYGYIVSHAPKLTKSVLESINPAVTILNNTPSHLIDGKWPFDWFTNRWPVIYVHHNTIYGPVYPAIKHLFVTKKIFEPYKVCLNRISDYAIVPPCIDVKQFDSIPRKGKNERCVIGKFSNKHPDRYPIELIDIFKKVQEKYPNVGFSILGGKEYYGDIDLKNCSMPVHWSVRPEQFYKDIDILVQRNTDKLEDSWGRVTTEAMAAGLPVVAEKRGGMTEQIDHGDNGFLCENDDDFVEYIKRLVDEPFFRWSIGMRAREKARKFWGLDRLRKETIDIVLKLVMGVY